MYMYRWDRIKIHAKSVHKSVKKKSENGGKGGRQEQGDGMDQAGGREPQ
jgi:hypothetical protein